MKLFIAWSCLCWAAAVALGALPLSPFGWLMGLFILLLVQVAGYLIISHFQKP